MQSFIAKKKKEFFENKLTESVGKSKDLGKALKSLGLPNKSGGCIISALAEYQILKLDTKSIFETFKIFYSNLTGMFLAKVAKSPNRYAINLLADYYRNLTIYENFKLVPTADDALFKLVKNIEVIKPQELIKFQGNF